MLIDCDTCQVRALRCGDCVVTVLLGLPAVRAASDLDRSDLDLDYSERMALAALADGGLIPPLRLVSGA